MLTSVKPRPDKYVLGECYRLSQSDRCVDDLCPTENVPPARAVVRGATAGSCQLVGLDSYVGTLSADMVSGGIASLTGKIVEPDGTETAIALGAGNGGTFDTSQAVTAGNIKTYLEGLDDDLTVTLSNSNRTFTLTLGGGKRLVITAGFTRSGSGTASFTNTKALSGAVRGISERDRSGAYLLTFDGADDTVGYYLANKSMVPVIFRGDPAVQVFGDVTVGATPYVVLEDYTDSDSVLNPRGSFRGDTDGGAAPVAAFTGAEFSGPKDNGLAPISILKV